MSGNQKAASGSKTSPAKNYEAVALPSQPPSEFSYVERRAELLQLCRQSGHPSRLNQTELADRYEVSQQQISKDFDRLGEFLEENLGSRRYLTTEAVIDRSIRGMLDNEQFRQASRTILEWNEFVREEKQLRELTEKVERLEEMQQR